MADLTHTSERNLPPDRARAGEPANSDSRAWPFAVREVRLPWQAWLALALAVALGLALLGSVEALLRPLALLFLSFVLAAALAPVVDWLAQHMRRSVAVAAVYLLMAALLVGLLLLASPALVEQARELRDGVPDALRWVEGWIERIGLLELAPMVGQLMSSPDGLGSRLLALPMTFSDWAFDLFLVVFLSLYALMSGPGARDFLLSLFPEEEENAFLDTAGAISSGIGGYVRGVFITAAFIGVATYIGLSIIGAPYLLVLGVLAAVLEVVPVLGTTISTIIITAVAFTASMSTGLITFAFMAGLQLVEGNVLFPNIVGRQSDTSPLLSLFAFFAGLSVGGIVGALIGVPIAVTLRVLAIEVAAPMVRRWTGAEEPDADEARSAEA